MNLLSLFAGIGGFDLAFERAGVTVSGQCEILNQCQLLLARRFPGVPLTPDVRDVKQTSVDIICGGFPCQDISLAGRRKGLAGDRSKLWWEFARVIVESQPRWVVVENVTGLLSSNGGRDMAAILGTLGRFGYGWSYRVLDAQFFGVPQRRRRVFIVGYRGDWRRAGEVLLESGGGNWNPPSSEGTRTVASALTQSGLGGGGPDDNLAQANHLIATPRARKLTPVECERLQGFADGWTEGFSDTVRYRMLGNAVAVPVVEWIGRRLVAVENGEKP